MEGAKPYQGASERAAARSLAEGAAAPLAAENGRPTLNFTPYQAPAKQAYATGGPESGSSEPTASSAPSAADKTGELKVTGPRKWGPAGYNQPGSKEERESPAASAPPRSKRSPRSPRNPG